MFLASILLRTKQRRSIFRNETIEPMKKYILLSFGIVFILACKQEKESLLPGVKGEANDIIVVMSGDFWESEPGETIRAGISELVPGLPQEEPKFDYLHVPHSNFSQVYKRQRNILITKITPGIEKRLLVQYDTWANTQVVLTIMAPNPEEFIKLYNEKASEINDIIFTAELKRIQQAHKANPEKAIVGKLKRNHNIDLTIPKGYKLNSDTTNFVYLINEYRDITEGVLVYYYPYTDTNTFTNEYLINKRNSLTKKYVPGEADGSYMITEDKYEPDTFEYNLNGNRYTKEIRGLWKIKDGFAMGGPFISITQYDEARKRIVTVEGFIFAPAHDKRNLIRRVEAIVYSLDFVENTPE